MEKAEEILKPFGFETFWKIISKRKLKYIRRLIFFKKYS
jgi:hypothetical protein